MTCDKTVYPTKELAQIAITGLQHDKRKRSPKKKVQKAYHCDGCSGWHIASGKPMKEKRTQFTNTKDLHILADRNRKDAIPKQTLRIQNFTSNPIK